MSGVTIGLITPLAAAFGAKPTSAATISIRPIAGSLIAATLSGGSLVTAPPVSSSASAASLAAATLSSPAQLAATAQALPGAIAAMGVTPTLTSSMLGAPAPPAALNTGSPLAASAVGAPSSSADLSTAGPLSGGAQTRPMLTAAMTMLDGSSAAPNAALLTETAAMPLESTPPQQTGFTYDRWLSYLAYLLSGKRQSERRRRLLHRFSRHRPQRQRANGAGLEFRGQLNVDLQRQHPNATCHDRAKRESEADRDHGHDGRGHRAGDRRWGRGQPVDATD